MNEVKSIKGRQLCDTNARNMASKRVILPTNEDGTTNNGTVGQFAVSDGNGGITWHDVADGNEVEW